MLLNMSSHLHTGHLHTAYCCRVVQFTDGHWTGPHSEVPWTRGQLLSFASVWHLHLFLCGGTTPFLVYTLQVLGWVCSGSAGARASWGHYWLSHPAQTKKRSSPWEVGRKTTEWHPLTDEALKEEPSTSRDSSGSDLRPIWERLEVESSGLLLRCPW